MVVRLSCWHRPCELKTNHPRKPLSQRGTGLASWVGQTDGPMDAYFLPPMMRNSFVPQSGQTPWIAGRPFFMVTSCGFAISFFALHFTQYASATMLASLWVRISLRKLGRILLAAPNKRQGAKLRQQYAIRRHSKVVFSRRGWYCGWVLVV